MNLANLLIFTGIYAVAVATPGPGIAALVARVLRKGLKGLSPMVAGFVVGDFIWYVVAAGGLAVIAQTFSWLFLTIKYAGAAYLVYLAWKSWTAHVVPLDSYASQPDVAPLTLFLSTLSLTLGNPKVIVFFLSIMPLVVDMARLDAQVFATLGAIIAVVLVAVLLAYALLAHRARQLFRSAIALRWLNRGVAVVLTGAASMIAAR